LKNKHKFKEEKIDELLGPAKHRRGKRKVTESDPPPPRSSPLPIECDRQILAEPQQRPLIERSAATHASPRFLPVSEEDFAVIATYHAIYEHFRFVHSFLYATYTIDSALRFPPAHLGESGGGSTTADNPPNSGMPHAPAFSSAVGGHTSPVSEDPTVEQSRSTDPHLYPGLQTMMMVRSRQTPSPPQTDAASESTLADTSSRLGQLGI
jgi:hypothetical protein